MKKCYKFCNYVFEINTVFDYFHEFAKEYLVEEKPDYLIKIDEDQVKQWASSHDDCVGFSLEYIETLVIHAQIGKLLATKNSFIFHGSTIAFDGLDNCYIFTAPSGTGKSTHVNLLRKVIGDKIVVINDDKPFINIENNKVKVFGSPWNGKEKLSNNVAGDLKGIFVLERSKNNAVSSLPPKTAVSKLIGQLYIPRGVEEAKSAAKALAFLCSNVPMYLLSVNMNDDAAKTSMKIMEKK